MIDSLEATVICKSCGNLECVLVASENDIEAGEFIVNKRMIFDIANDVLGWIDDGDFLFCNDDCQATWYKHIGG